MKDITLLTEVALFIEATIEAMQVAGVTILPDAWNLLGKVNDALIQATENKEHFVVDATIDEVYSPKQKT